MEHYFSYLETSKEPMIQLGGKYLSYNILIELGICLPMKQVRLIRICSNETYNKVRIGKHLKMSVFWVVVTCSLVEVYRRFRGDSSFHHRCDDKGSKHP
jgi:hypothetical protein